MLGYLDRRGDKRFVKDDSVPKRRNGTLRVYVKKWVN